jgi:hypothetical protein
MARASASGEGRATPAREPGALKHAIAAAIPTALALGLSAACEAPPRLAITDVGRYDFVGGDNSNPALVAEELSGIAWLQGDAYVAVSDDHACLHRLRVDIDPGTGEVRGATFGEPLALRDSSGRALDDSTGLGDREDVAYDPGRNSVWIAHEARGEARGESALAEYSLETGTILRVVSPRSEPGLRIFARGRDNRGFESLARRSDGEEWWTANEEALAEDGPASSAGNGTTVRLVRLDREMKPVAQYAYFVDPPTGAIRGPSPYEGVALAGVPDLVVLPDGRLVALERMFAGDSEGAPTNRIRIYLVDYGRATDLSKGAEAEGLEGKKFTLATKTLLWEKTFTLPNSNFEGLTLGPPLANGDVSLLLIADNQSGTQQALYALRLSGLRE